MMNPSMPFYPSDFFGEIALFTDEQTGKYIKLLSLAYLNGGRLTKDEIIFICGGEDKKILGKFKVDEEGSYYHERTVYEMNKREDFAMKKQKKTKAKAVKKDTPIKKEYGNYSNVLLTDEQYGELLEKFGESLTSRIKALDDYIEMNGKQDKYKSHYAVIINWDEKSKAELEIKNKKDEFSTFDVDDFFQAAVERTEELYRKNRVGVSD